MPTSYVIPAWDPLQVAKVGWRAEWGSYWFIVYRKGPFGETELEDPEISYTMGVDETWRKITNVGDLLIYTWGEIKWESPDGLYALRGLRDDPIFDALYESENTPQSGVDAFVVHAFDSRAITAANDATRGHAKPVAPVPKPLVGQAARPVPTAQQRIAALQRHVLRRINPD